ncbi:MAG: MATE family efflux transporter [Planctomycetaceae bacterium]
MTVQDEKQPKAGSINELLRVAIPLFLSSGSLSLMHVIDRMYLTWYSTDALAAALPSGIIHWTVMSVVIGTVNYLNTFVAQYEGARQNERVVASVWQGVYTSLAASVVFLFFIPLAGPFFSLTNHSPEMQRLETEYFVVNCIGTLPLVLQIGLSCFYSGRGKTQVVMWINFLIAAVNIVFDYALIFGWGPFPRLGIAGAAWGSNIAYFVGCSTLIGLMIWGRDSREYQFWQGRGFDPQLFRRLLRYGLPSGLNFLADIAGFSVFIFFVSDIGKIETAATNLAFNLNSLAFIPMIGFGTAVLTIVGKRIGEGRPELAVRTTWLAAALVGAYMLFFAAIYLLFPGPILYIYSIYGDPAEFELLREITISLLKFVAMYSFFDGMAIVFGSAVRGAGDTRFSLIFTIICAWSVMVAPTWYFSHQGTLTLNSAWWACTVYVMAMGIGFIVRFQSGKWKSMRVIEDSFADETSANEENEKPVAQPAKEVLSSKHE